MLNIRELRKGKGLTATELAEKLGVAVCTVSHWERGIRTPHASEIVRIVEVLGCSIDDLFECSTKNDDNPDHRVVLKIKEYRKAKHLTMKWLGEVVGAAENTVCQWENGKRSPNPWQILKIAQALGCSINDLFGYSTKGGDEYVSREYHDEQQAILRDEIKQLKKNTEEMQTQIDEAYDDGVRDEREKHKSRVAYMRGVIEGLRLSQKVIKKEPFEEDISEPRRIRVIDALQPIDAETFVEVRRADDRAIVCDSGTPAELVEANRECLYTNVAEIEPRAAGYVVIFGYAEEKAAQEAPIEAKWENANTPAAYKCSACGGAPMYSKPEHAPEQYDRAFLTLSKFCPHCGAKMASPTDDDEDNESEEERKNGGV